MDAEKLPFVVNIFQDQAEKHWFMDVEAITQIVLQRGASLTNDGLSELLSLPIQTKPASLWQAVAVGCAQRLAEAKLPKLSEPELAFADACAGACRNKRLTSHIVETLKINYSVVLAEALGALTGYTLPTKELVETIKATDLPVLEVGAGRGFVARALQGHVRQFSAVDNFAGPYASYTDRIFAPIQRMDAQIALADQARRNPRMAVLMCYPSSPRSATTAAVDMPFNVIKKMREHDELIVVGRHGRNVLDTTLVTGSERFWDSVVANFEPVALAPLYRWPHGSHPDAMVFRKTTGPAA